MFARVPYREYTHVYYHIKWQTNPNDIETTDGNANNNNDEIAVCEQRENEIFNEYLPVEALFGCLVCT